jgi:AbrB family looped-hinge helix DNA binding protein
MAKVTAKLQVTVPKALADRIGLRPGDEFEWRAEGATLRVVPASAAPALTLPERLARFDEAMRRQDDRDRGRKSRAGAAPRTRGWTRDELYGRGRAR